MTSPPDLLRIENLHINFRVHSTLVEAVRGASFRIRPGKVTALVGESGSGKSVIGQSIMGILPKVGAISGGSITFNDPEATGGPIQIEQLLPSGPEMRELRGGRIAMIFQEPMNSLSPLHTIGNQISGSAGAASEGRQVRRAGQDRGNAGAGRVSKSVARLRHVLLRIVRRIAPTGDDRDGADLPAGAADRR
jgi:ABC-type dipeptide/oligopeptide/nickel transport system ATPase component